MPIDLTCGQCGKTLRVPDDAAGKKARCPSCQSLSDVPLTAVELVSDAPPSAQSLPNENAYRSPASFGSEPSGSPFAPPKNLGDDAAIRMLLPVGRSLWAIAAGYFGLFSLVCLPAPIAVILGLIAIWDIRHHPEKHGMGRAIFGLAMGLAGSLGFVLMMISFARGR
jgi:hypothetical protein